MTHANILHRCSWVGCMNRVKNDGIACFYHSRIEEKRKMAFEKVVIGDATLYRGDCLAVMQTMTKGDADMLLTDPPYGVEFVGRAGVHEMLHNDHKGFDVAPYIEAALKVLRRGRHVYVFGPLEVSKYALCSEIELIWDKEIFGLGNLEVPWGPQHERITFAIHEISKANRDNGFGALAARLRRGSVLRSLRPHSGRAKNHPTEKPLDILAQMIESSTTMGETVLDPFMGSGSTIVAAVLERRKAIGIEIDPKHFATACRRVEEAQQQDLMFAAPEVGAGETAVQGDMLLPANLK